MTDSRADDRLRSLNALSADRAFEWLRRCCGSSRWANRMVEARPFDDEAALFTCAGRIWSALDADDWLEAFRAHPRIGDGMERPAASAPPAQADRWSAGEQASVALADREARTALRAANEEYERRFGRIFIICATGKSAHEMLAQLRARLRNDPDEELRVAAAEQQAITALRLRKLLRDDR